MGLSYGEEIMIVGRTMWTQSTSVTDRQTDRRTDRITVTKTVQRRASHGKNCWQPRLFAQDHTGALTTLIRPQTVLRPRLLDAHTASQPCAFAATLNSLATDLRYGDRILVQYRTIKGQIRK